MISPRGRAERAFSAPLGKMVDAITAEIEAAVEQREEEWQVARLVAYANGCQATFARCAEIAEEQAGRVGLEGLVNPDLSGAFNMACSRIATAIRAEGAKSDG